MKKIVLSLAFVLMGTLAFANTKEVKSTIVVKPVVEKKVKVVKPQYWTAKCSDGSIGGYFYCDCTQVQANQIAAIMCK